MLVLLKITNTVQGVLVGNHFIPLPCRNFYDASLMKIVTFNWRNPPPYHYQAVKESWMVPFQEPQLPVVEHTPTHSSGKCRFDLCAVVSRQAADFNNSTDCSRGAAEANCHLSQLPDACVEAMSSLLLQAVPTVAARVFWPCSNQKWQSAEWFIFWWLTVNLTQPGSSLVLA